MARVNVEESWWSDPRRARLISLIGNVDSADGAALNMWRLAQEFWKKEKRPIPKEIFETFQHSLHLLGSCLAEEREDGIYVRGSSSHLDWIYERRKSGSLGGQKSSLRARDAMGRLKKSSKQNLSKRKQIQTSSSVSVSDSVSESSSDLNTKTKDKYTFTNVNGDPVASVGNQINNLVAYFISSYVNAYQERYGKEARPSLSGRVRGQIITLLKETPLKRACALITHYCQMDDGWFRTKGHDFSTFVENLTKVGLSLDTGVAPDRKKTRAEEISAYNAEMDAKILRGEV